MKKNGFWTKFGGAILALLLLVGYGTGLIPMGGQEAEPGTQTVLQELASTFGTPDVLPKQDEPIIEPQAIADFIFEYGRLPDNFITKSQAKAMGWDSEKNDLSDVAPGFSIGGDRFGNYEGLLPEKPGRKYYEADCYYTEGNRNAHRVVFSNDRLVFYTSDHYESFVELKPSAK